MIPSLPIHTITFPKDRPIVLTIARLSPEKQITTALHIHHQLKLNGINFIWYIVGDGLSAPLQQKEIKRLNMQNDFILVGAQTNIPSWIKKADLFVLLSTLEGCPTVIIEALTLGVPVLTTHVHGVEELVQHEHTGIIVNNEISEITQSLSKLITDLHYLNYLRNNVKKSLPISNPHQETQFLIDLINMPRHSFPSLQVSILIPTYNQAAYLNQAIASALMQDFPSLEVIVLDDASTDKTNEIVQKWQSDSRLTYIRRPHNIGRVANYQDGLFHHAKGEWVLMLDGDDYLTDPCFILNTWQAIHEQVESSRIVFAQAGHRVHYLNQTHPDVDILPNILQKQKLVSPEEYLHLVFQTGFFTHLGTLYRRQAALECSGYQNDISSSDMDFLLKLALNGKVLLLNTIAGCWVQHQTNSSSNVPFSEISANVRIFRYVTQLAIQRGLTSYSRINNTLTRYETRTIAFLIHKSLQNESFSSMRLLDTLYILYSINPLLIFSVHRIYPFYSYLRRFLKLILTPYFILFKNNK